MYPQTELIELQARKLALRRRIALRRSQIMLDAYQCARPLMLLDKLSYHWRRISPFIKLAVVPLGLLLKRQLFRRGRASGTVSETVLRWAPALVGALVKSARH